MRKRKVSVEKDSGHRESFARASAPSLRATAGASRQGQPRSAKPPSVQNDSSDKPADNRRTMLDRGDEVQPARSKCNSRDMSKDARSNPSPRLKSFPAERIKKLDDPSTFSPVAPIGAVITQQNPREGGTFFVGVGNNNGQGDATSPSQTPPEPLDGRDANRRQIAAEDPQIARASPQSDSLTTGRVIASPEGGQTHRPSVPDVFMCERSPRRPPTIDRAFAVTQQPPRDSHAALDRNGEAARFESQPIDGRSAIDHERLIERQARQRGLARGSIDQANASPDDRSNDPRDCPGVDPLRSPCHGTRLHGGDCCAFYHAPRQIYQQAPQHGAYTTQQMLPYRSMPGQPRDRSETRCDHCQRSSITGQGMTSPQDMTMNRTTRRRDDSPARRQNPVDLPSAWPRDDRWTADRRHAHWQEPPQWRYCCRPCDARDSCQRNPEDPDRSARSQPSRRTSDERRSSDRQQAAGEQKLPFTPDMIRDQELLVSTMRQQAVPEDVMRRQFNALLNEQRRHLAYVAQFRRCGEDSSPGPKSGDASSSSCRVTRRRTDRDEKPEWMMHITPPRLSYSEAGGTRPRERESSPRREISAAVQSRQVYYQTSPRQTWAQQRAAQRHWPYRCGHRTPRCCAAACNPYDCRNASSDSVCLRSHPTPGGYEQQALCRYPRNAAASPPVDAANARYVAYPDWRGVRFREEHDANSSRTTDGPDAVPTNPAARFYDEPTRPPPPEPSSLLKMRVYRETIRPQVRNNGLQDVNCIRTALEELKDPASRRGLEYLVNLARRKAPVRLNGAQDPAAVPADLELRPPAATDRDTSQIRKRVAANGLENGRNPDNPVTRVLRPGRADEPATTEYPRQKRDGVRAEKRDGAMAISRQQEDQLALSGARNAETGPANAAAMACDHHHTAASRFADSAAPHYRQTTQQSYHHPYGPPSFVAHNGGQGDVAIMPRPNAPHSTRIDRAGGDNVGVAGTAECIANYARPDANAYDQPEIYQTRPDIGSVAYPAGKPDYAVNDLAVTPERLIASRHLQPPMIL